MGTIGSEVVEEILTVCGTTTSVLKCGPITAQRTLFLIIPGNPGVALYYELFMKVLYSRANRRYPVWCVSHAGHGQVANFSCADKGVDTFGLVGQTRHKLAFIANYVPPDVKLVLIGHSIGCYVILHMLRDLDPSRVIKCALLFPTIERLAATDIGRKVTPWVKHFHGLASLPMYPAYLVPTPFKDMILRWYFRGRGVPPSAIEATRRLANPRSVANVAYLGNQEMQRVVRADYDILDRHMDKLMFYYGSQDHWCPVEYYRDMKARYPGADIRLCTRDFDHAFILVSGEGMAQVLWDWLTTVTDTIS